MATINDISKLANVSKSTVSRYLNNGSISDTNREKIKKVIDELDYTPNSFAQSLKASNSNNIMAIIPNFIGFSKNITLTEIDRKLKENGYNLLISNSDDDIDKEISLLKNTSSLKVDGILLFASKITKEHISIFNSLEIPIVIIGQKVPNVPCVYHDDYKAGRITGEYILTTSHKEITYFGVGEYDKGIKERYNGLIDVLNTDKKIKRNVHYLELGFEPTLAYNKTKEILSNTTSTFFIATTDNMAYGIIRGITECNKKVPKDISVSGFGDYSNGHFFTPNLSTVHFDYINIGSLATEKLFQIINKEKYDLHTKLDCYFVKRESSK